MHRLGLMELLECLQTGQLPRKFILHHENICKLLSHKGEAIVIVGYPSIISTR
jgi:hypothetical protein